MALITLGKSFASSLRAYSTDQVEWSTEEPFYEKSCEKRGIALKSLLLKDNFEGFPLNWFNPNNEIYILSYSWDLSGMTPYVYPSPELKLDNVIKIKTGKVYPFLGEGLNLFPGKEVSGGINVRIHLWESDEDTRKVGQILKKVFELINKSELSKTLKLLPLEKLTLSKILLIKEISVELGNLLAQFLINNSNDYVDFFEGYFPSSVPWKVGCEECDHPSSRIVLNKY